MAYTISRIILFVKDVEAVAKFYQKHFGLEQVGAEEDGWLELAAGGCNLALHRGRLPVGASRVTPAKIVFAVDDVQAAVAKFAQEGLKFGKVHEWNDIAFADARDPEGNPIQISSRGV